MLQDQSMMGGTPSPAGQGMPGQPGNQPAQGGPEMAGQIPMGPPMEDPMAPVAEEQGDSTKENQVNEFLSLRNIADALKKKKTKDGSLLLDKIGNDILRGIKADEASRQDWLKANKEALEMAMLVRKERSFPWQHASNIKYPLIATAAMQFSARAYPALLPSDGKYVKVEVNQLQAPVALYDSAKRVAEHMSFQLRERVPDWEENADKLLMTLAITGSCFMKTYHDTNLGVNRSDLVYPENLIINYYARSLEQAYRKTEILHYTNNDVYEKVAAGEFLDVELGDPPAPELFQEPLGDQKLEDTTTLDEATPHEFFACHTFYDLDDDGYEEPYVITIHSKSGKVVRMVARYDIAGVKEEDGKIVRILPVEYFTAFSFIPNPDGSIYGMGFGTLLGPLNESVNSLINQLVDAGTLSNLQSGFIAKGLRLKIGETSLGPGEWKVVNGTGDDLQKGVFPMPVREPSAVLMQLMQILVTSANQLASISEIMVGKMPGQNTPATTTQETVQQGMAVFTAVYKRVFRSLKKVYKKMYRLNKIIGGMMQEEAQISGIPLEKSDYDFPDWMIVPGADPVGDSKQILMQKHSFVLQSLVPLGTVNPMAVTERVVRDLEIPEGQALLMQPQPQEDPKAKQAEAQMQLLQQKAQLEAQMKQQEMEHKKAMFELEMQMKEKELEFKEREFALKAQMKEQESALDMQLKQQQTALQAQDMQVQSQAKRQQAATDMQVSDQMAKQKLRQGEQAFQQKQKQAKQTQAAQPKEGQKPKK